MSWLSRIPLAEASTRITIVLAYTHAGLAAAHHHFIWAMAFFTIAFYASELLEMAIIVRTTKKVISKQHPQRA